MSAPRPGTSERVRWRREFLRIAGASLAAAAVGSHSRASWAASPRVVVVGAGYGGATAAKYIRKWSGGKIDVTVVEREAAFVSCPVSNLVIGGSRTLADITVPFDGLVQWGARIVHDEAVDIDPVARSIKLRRGDGLSYDRLILSPGVDFIYDDIPSLRTAEAQARAPHAWKAGPQTVLLRAQLEAMADGGVFAIHIPKAPFRCPPAPYERACQVAHYFSTHKKKSRIIVLDSNEEIQSKKALFANAWESLYKGYIDYRPNSALVDVDFATRTLQLDFENVKADVINVIPPQRAGAIARRLGMANANDRFCQVDFLTYESTAQRGIHVLGDAIQVAPLMPKSGHMANQQAKVCAAAIVALLSGEVVNPTPIMANACYSYIDDKQAGHVTSVHAYDSAQKTMIVAPGSGGVSQTATESDGVFADAWAHNIWADMLL
jgi:sulfide dehydrogenase [flavocytochrome c] flavoprotein chain